MTISRHIIKKVSLGGLSLLLGAGLLTGCGGGGGGSVTPPVRTNTTQVPTNGENIGVEVGFSPLGIQVRQRVDQDNPVFSLIPKTGQRTIPGIDLTGFGQSMDVIMTDEPFVQALYPQDLNISAFGETYCLMVVDPETLVQDPCNEVPNPLQEPVGISFTFDPSKVPTGFSPADATIFRFDGQQWWDMGATVDPIAGIAELDTALAGLVKLGFRRHDQTIPVNLVKLTIQVSQNTLMEGQTMALKAYAKYTNNTIRDVSAEARFTTSDQTRAILIAGNRLQGISEGQTRVIATYNSLSSQDKLVTVVDVEPPAPISVLSGSILPSGSEVFLTWVPPGATDVTFYEIFGSSTPFTDIFAPGVTKMGQANGLLTQTFTLSGVPNGTLHLAVVAVDDSGNKNRVPDHTVQLTLQDLTPPPAVIPTLTITQGSVGVLVDWTAYNSSDARKYTVRRAGASFANVNEAAIIADNLTEKTYLDASATAAGTYHYAVVAVDAAGNQLTDLPAEAVVSITIP